MKRKIALLLILVALVMFGVSYAVASGLNNSSITISSDKVTEKSEITIGQGNSTITIGQED